MPIWLEATTPRSRDVYLKLGFEVVEEIVLGKGKAGEDGRAKKGGEGVKVWAMIWRPTPREPAIEPVQVGRQKIMGSVRVSPE